MDCLSFKVLIIYLYIFVITFSELSSGLEFLSCDYSEVLERFLPLGDLHWDGWSRSQIMSLGLAFFLLPCCHGHMTHMTHMTCECFKKIQTYCCFSQHVNHCIVVDSASTYAGTPQGLLGWKQLRCLHQVIWCSRQEGRIIYIHTFILL